MLILKFNVTFYDNWNHMNAHLLSTNVANYNCEYVRIGELITTNYEQITWYINTSTYIKQCLYIETII